MPNFQLGQRHRASSGLTLAGGKGINVARALKRLDVPVDRDRPRRRPHRHAHRRGADRARRSSTTSSAIARRVAHVDGRRRPDRRARTPRSTSGGRHVRAGRARRCCSRSSTTSRAAPSTSSSPARCRAASTRASTREAIRDLKRRGVQTVLDSEGEPLRLGVEAEPFARLAEPARGRGARRPGVRRRRGLPHGARPDRRAGRAQRADHAGGRLLRAAARGARAARRFRARGARARGRLGGRLGRRAARRVPRRARSRARPAEESLRARGRGRRRVDARGRRRALRPARGDAAQRRRVERACRRRVACSPGPRSKGVSRGRPAASMRVASAWRSRDSRPEELERLLALGRKFAQEGPHVRRRAARPGRVARAAERGLDRARG